MKSVMISIQPKWCELIASNKKTIEVRKTRPKIETPFKCYIYCTKQIVLGEILLTCNKKVEWRNRGFRENGDIPLAGKVIGEFVCDKIEDFSQWEYDYASLLRHIDLYAGTNGDYHFLNNYLKGKKQGYGWHISNLKIYDNPKKLSDFYKPLKYDEDGIICGTKQEISDIYEWGCEIVFKKKYTKCTLKDCPQLQKFYRLNKPPQSWCYVEELEVE